ncbi:TauD/TfdA family dioxygenase [Lysobacter enzymogenes]|uniref:TauD/TfdA family dioxygenase n=1 Tax=Lysobacter enzymogenes TaxID=69 RepID=UPI00099CF881|nr:TauD/TfdA family dioxygenase [Lysobacter enzymogenes]UZW58370.1 TauD/TfdA family dioxygenase [Lysobacter enzymogenes]
MSENILSRRKGIRLSQGDLVRYGYLDGMEGFPLVVSPGVDGLNLAGWAAGHRAEIEQRLLDHGAILFRGFCNETVEHFSRFVRAVASDVLDYQERAAARSQVAAQIFTSTEYPADQAIPLHHEMSYSHNWPSKIWFYCRQPAAAGGRTPIADDRKVVELLSPAIKRRFLEKGVMYVKNYGDGLDLSWQDAFQTEDRAEVERYCREAMMQWEWRSGGRLRTRSLRHVMVSHPKLGTTLWFNHAHMFHLSNLSGPVRAGLLAQFAEDEVPRNAFFGDGSPIPDELLDEVRETYARVTVGFDWQRGDILLLDNFLASHGREPFKGPREILVAMAERFTLAPASAPSGSFEQGAHG